MLTFLKNVFKKGELRRKVIFTLGILFVYRLGAGITIPGVNVGSLSSSDATNGIFGIMNLLGGGTLERFSLFALGVSAAFLGAVVPPQPVKTVRAKQVPKIVVTIFFITFTNYF